MEQVDLQKLSLSCLCLVAAHAIGFFQMNLRFIVPSLADKGVYIACLFSVPMTLLFYNAWGYSMDAFHGSAWSSRFLSFGVSYFIFPVLTMYFLNETMFTLKTMSCVALSMLILWIQIKL